MVLCTADVPSPIGTIRLVCRRDGILCSLDFKSNWKEVRQRLEERFEKITFRKDHSLSCKVLRLKRYLSGDLHALDRVKVDTGGTPFQQKVWKALRRIPPGKTISYGELAERIGMSGGARAVGAANRANPIPIVIPCHRVIGSNGTLTGYAGGLDRKLWLLRHEGADFVDSEVQLEAAL